VKPVRKMGEAGVLRARGTGCGQASAAETGARVYGVSGGERRAEKRFRVPRIRRMLLLVPRQFESSFDRDRRNSLSSEARSDGDQERNREGISKC